MRWTRLRGKLCRRPPYIAPESTHSLESTPALLRAGPKCAIHHPPFWLKVLAEVVPQHALLGRQHTLPRHSLSSLPFLTCRPRAPAPTLTVAMDPDPHSEPESDPEEPDSEPEESDVDWRRQGYANWCTFTFRFLERQWVFFPSPQEMREQFMNEIYENLFRWGHLIRTLRSNNRWTPNM